MRRHWSPSVFGGAWTRLTAGWPRPADGAPRGCYGAACAAAALGCAAAPVQAGAVSLPNGRTMLVAAPFVVPNAASAQPSISADGRYVAFVSAATNLTAPTVDATAAQIYLYDSLAHAVRLVSAASDGGPAADASSHPSLSADASVIAFSSRAGNLAPGAAKMTTNIFLRTGDGALRLITRGVGGSPTDGDSYQPAVSADGRFVVFTSNADNLIAGDDNGKPDVFEYDVRAGTISRVSTATGGAQVDGPSSNASVNGNGRLVTFASSSTNVVGHQRRAAQEVYLHDTVANRTDLVSAGRAGRRQNASVPSPLTQVSSISADGRYIAFDSAATNLTPHSTNGHINIFVRDRLRRRTRLVSLSIAGDAGSEDSFAPAMSPDGRFVIFDSLADDLAPGAAPGANVYLRDLQRATMTTVDVSTSSRPRSPELRPGPLQQPVVSRGGTLAVFESGANNLTGTASNGVDNLFLRQLAAPRTIAVRPPAATSSRRPRVAYRADDPFATLGLCQVDEQRRICRLGSFRLPALAPGPHRLSFAAGGNGMQFDPAPVVTHFRVR